MSPSPIDRLLDLSTPAVAIAFLPAAPAGVPHVSQSEAAGCGYWRRAAAGEVFHTTAPDHLNCPIGAHTHNVPMTAEQGQELQGLVQIMVGLQYLKMEDVAAIPQRQGTFGVVVYAPLAKSPCPPDVVLVRGSARQLMLLAEASGAAGVAGAGPTMGRPTCAVLPEAINSGKTSASFGCVGNRVYTGAGESEGYFAIPGHQLAAVEEKLAIIVAANAELAKFHEARKASFAARAQT